MLSLISQSSEYKLYESAIIFKAERGLIVRDILSLIAGKKGNFLIERSRADLLAYGERWTWVVPCEYVQIFPG